MASSSHPSMTDDTLIIHSGTPLAVGDNEVSCDAVPAIHVTSSYMFKSAERLLDASQGREGYDGKDGYLYRRYGNENTTDLATAVAQLEGADEAVCLTCGMAAVSSAFIAAGVLSGNKKILGPYSCYGSTYTLMKSRFSEIAECEFVDMGDTQAAIAAIRRMKPDILYMETSSNPLTVISDMGLLSAEAKGANPSATSIVDNTYTTPLLVKPLSLGVDVVLHSMTKYINGHGDVLAGLIASNSKEYMHRVQHTVIDFGTTLSPWDAWLCMRGLRTLGVRMSKIGDNALKVAKNLASNCRVSRVSYPGLPSHPHFFTAKKLLASTRKLSATEEKEGFSFSGMISFDINAPGGDENGIRAAKVFLDSMQLISSQVSLGDVKTLASAPGLSTQHQVDPVDRLKTGIKPTTIRVSVGMENAADICADIEQALVCAVTQPPPASSVEGLRTSTPSVEETGATAVQQGDNVSVDNDTVGDSSTLADKIARLKELYDQMNAITSEVEKVQESIKKDQAQLQEKVSI